MKIKIGEEEKEVILSIETLTIYEEEFDRDMLQDLFGVVELRKSDLKSIDEDAAEKTTNTEKVSSENEDNDDVVLTIDYTTTNWTAITRSLWAGLRTADRSVPAFAVWAKEVDHLNLNSINAQLTPECIRQFFR